MHAIWNSFLGAFLGFAFLCLMGVFFFFFLGGGGGGGIVHSVCFFNFPIMDSNLVMIVSSCLPCVVFITGSFVIFALISSLKFYPAFPDGVQVSRYFFRGWLMLLVMVLRLTQDGLDTEM